MISFQSALHCFRVIMKHPIIIYAALIASACSSVVAEEQVPVLSRWTIEDPLLVVPAPIRVLPESWQLLWADALTGPEEDLRREAAEAILAEHYQNNTGVLDLKAALLQGFRTSTITTVRLSLATTLIAMDVSESAADLYAFRMDGNQRAIRRIEPALAHWEYEPMVAVWKKRLEQPQYFSGAELVFAIQGLAETRTTEALPHLLRLAMDPSVQTRTRLTAADGIATLQTQNLESLCRNQLKQPNDHQLTDRQVAIRMLDGHSSLAAQKVMLLAAKDPHSSVSVVAIRRLLQLQPAILRPVLPDLLESSDAAIRRLSMKAVAFQPSVKATSQIAELLNDPHPGVRNDARIVLKHFADEDDLARTVSDHGEKHLCSSDWRGIEQAARLLGALDYETVADRLVDLLNHERSEVQVTAAWALRELQVTETLAPIHEFSQRRSSTPSNTAVSADRTVRLQADDACLSYLFEALGRAQYKPAKPLLATFIPKRFDKGPLSRSAAIWALGRMHVSDPNDKTLVAALLDRTTDDSVVNPEYPGVRTAAAVSLGRMQSTESLGSLRSALSKPAGARTIEGIKWAIGQLSGVPATATKPRRLLPAQPFLRPLEE